MPVISMDCHEYESKLKKKKEAAERLMASNTVNSHQGSMEVSSPAPSGSDEVQETIKFREQEPIKRNQAQSQSEKETTTAIC